MYQKLVIREADAHVRPEQRATAKEAVDIIAGRRDSSRSNDNM